MFGNAQSVGSVGSVSPVNYDNDNHKKKTMEAPQVAFINTIFDNFGGNSSGTEASFNA